MPQDTRRRVAVYAVAGGLTAALLTACGGGSVTASGTISLWSGGTGPNDACRGTSGYSDINRGAEVTVFDADGTLVGAGNLETGTRDSPGGSCVFPFTVDVDGGGDLFQVEVSDRGRLTFQRDELTDIALEL